MMDILRYVSNRATSTKSIRLYSPGGREQLDGVVDLVCAKLGHGLVTSLLMLVVLMHQHALNALAGLWLASLISAIYGFYFAEFRSRFPRILDLTYRYVLFGGCELAAVVTGCLDIAKTACLTACFCRCTSAFLDFEMDMWIHNITEANLGLPAQTISGVTIDIVAFVLTLFLCIMAITSLGKRSIQNKWFRSVHLTFFLGLCLFIFGLGLPRILSVLFTDVDLSYGKIVQDTGLFLLAQDDHHKVFTSTDFRRLGIKTTVLRAYVICCVVYTVLFSSIFLVLFSLNNNFQAASLAYLPEVFRHNGLTWFKHIIGPLGIIYLIISAMYCIFNTTNSLSSMTSDGLLPKVCKSSNKSSSRSFLGFFIVGTMTCFIALSAPFDLLIHTAVLCVLAQYTCILSITLILRYKPTDHMFLAISSESVNLIHLTRDTRSPANQGSEQIADYLYGAFSNVDGENNASNDGIEEEEEDIDRVVEDFRLQRAAQIYRNRAEQTQATSTRSQPIPNRRSYSIVKYTTLIFTSIGLILSFIIYCKRYSLFHGDTLQISCTVILAFCLLLCLYVATTQPMDHILRKTLLIAVPKAAVLLLVTQSSLLTVAGALSVKAWGSVAGVLAFGCLMYLLSCILMLRDEKASSRLQDTSVIPQSTASNDINQTSDMGSGFNLPEAPTDLMDTSNNLDKEINAHKNDGYNDDVDLLNNLSSV